MRFLTGMFILMDVSPIYDDVRYAVTWLIVTRKLLKVSSDVVVVLVE